MEYTYNVQDLFHVRLPSRGVLPESRTFFLTRILYVDLQSLAYFPRIIVGRWVFVLFTIIIRSSLLPRRGSP